MSLLSQLSLLYSWINKSSVVKAYTHWLLYMHEDRGHDTMKRVNPYLQFSLSHTFFYLLSLLFTGVALKGKVTYRAISLFCEFDFVKLPMQILFSIPASELFLFEFFFFIVYVCGIKVKKKFRRNFAVNQSHARFQIFKLKLKLFPLLEITNKTYKQEHYQSASSIIQF